MAHAGGRPPKFSRKQLHELGENFKAYIEAEKIPIVAEFAARNGLSKQFLYEQSEFFDLIKLCTTKKEAALESGALKGYLNSTMAIFSLKQLGWRDKQEVEHSGEQIIYYSEKPQKPEDAGTG